VPDLDDPVHFPRLGLETSALAEPLRIFFKQAVLVQVRSPPIALRPVRGSRTDLASASVQERAIA
jgi:hypothetical protein